MQEETKRLDRKFMNRFSVVLGILALMVIAMFWIAHFTSKASPGSYDINDPTVQRPVNERLAPVGALQIAGQSETQASATPPSPGAAAAPAAVGAAASAETGRQIWQGTCSACHQTGVLGAPKIGDKAEWAPHLAKGFPVLEDHALHGFLQMPAKGGNPSLSDAEVVKALEYMISQSGGANLVPKGKQ
ncbi:MAG: c-type cytochrome [Gammaproteobacteria bacterium]